jgi:type III secretory pathway component EscS
MEQARKEIMPMTAQMLWIVLAVFVFGLFVGTNLGIMTICILQMAAQDRSVHDTAIPVSMQS